MLNDSGYTSIGISYVPAVLIFFFLVANENRLQSNHLSSEAGL